MEELSMTAQRQEVLGKVAAGGVAYLPASGFWSVEGEVVGGWTHRTLAELKANDYITVRVQSGKPSIVDLTTRGRESLGS